MKFTSIKALINKGAEKEEEDEQEEDEEEEDSQQNLASKYIPTMKFKSIKALMQ